MTLRNLINIHLEAVALDSIKNSDSFAKEQAEKYNSEVAKKAELVYSFYLKNGDSDELASKRRDIYISQNSKHWTHFK